MIDNKLQLGFWPLDGVVRLLNKRLFVGKSYSFSIVDLVSGCAATTQPTTQPTTAASTLLDED